MENRGFPKPIVITWDAFDTLIARHVPDPLIAIKLTQAELGMDDFLARRLAAQQALDRIGKPYVLADIYRRMSEDGLRPDLANRAADAETLAERRQMIPIARNVERVEPQDIVVSDMYLAPETLELFLQLACDLHTLRPIVRSNWGKNSGTIWPQILRRYVVRRHVGDNPVADAAVPQRFGIACELVQDAKPSAWERMLSDKGMPKLALLQREVRLRSIRSDAGAFHEAVVGPYLTLLVAHATFLLRQYGPDTDFVFLSRSADEARRVFSGLFPHAMARSLDLSRRLAGDPSVADFLARNLGPRSLAVDMVGTGRSFFGFAKGRSGCGRGLHLLVFLSTLLDAEDIRSAAQRRAEGRLAYICDLKGGVHRHLEHLFQAHYPPVGGIGEDAASGGLVRSYSASEYDRAESRLLGWKSAVVSSFLRVAQDRGFAPDVIPKPIDAISAAVTSIMKMPEIARHFSSFPARERFDHA